jgi:hypothetical protein
MILQADGGNLELVGEDLNRFLASSDGVLRAPWQERNVRLPINLRHNLDLLRDALTSAGLDQATRSHLMAAILTFHTPQTGEQMRQLLAEQRSETPRRTLATINEQTRS